MKRLVLGVIALAAGVGGVLAVSLPAGAQTPSGRMVTVVADGEARSEPDVAFLNAGVQAEGETAGEALNKANAQIQQVTAALRAAGIAEADIQTSGLNVFSVTGPPGPGNTMLPPVLGYRASNNLSVAVRNLANVNAVLDAVIAAGITNLNGVQFGIQDTTALQQRALANAVQQARPLAQAAAQAAGLTLGEIESVTELPDFAASPAPQAAAFGRGAGDSAVSGGTLTVRVRVQVSFRVAG